MENSIAAGKTWISNQTKFQAFWRRFFRWEADTKARLSATDPLDLLIFLNSLSKRVRKMCQKNGWHCSFYSKACAALVLPKLLSLKSREVSLQGMVQEEVLYGSREAHIGI
ncbi:hypothetical protein AVEN_184402-1 [Araneus ventricosus]|uniref:Uncharacterized protein n=1 Tax=Araneus ventricosus TaxID=182803 RepID=A0A4Y2BFL6_ARAVE|nr:hypothetical protein AVEN_184402-1 [Araneus ventricosus]